MRVYIFAGEIYGSCYYRAKLVSQWLNKIGVDTILTHTMSMRMLDKCDVFYFMRPTPDVVMIEKLHQMKREGMPIVVDTDDLLFETPIWSPAYATFDKFQVQEYYRRVYECADLVTASHRYIGEYFSKKYTPAPIRVIGNAFDTNIKLFRPKGTLKDDEIPCIGFSGGAQHEGDLDSIAGVWDECLKRGYGLRFLGTCPNCIIGKNRTEMINGNHVVDIYHQSLPLCEFDVGLAPLLDIEFNRCKSSLKAIEYQYLSGCPMVLQDLPPYEDFKADGKRIFKINGNDTNEWMDAIEKSLQVMRTEGRSYSINLKHTIDFTIHKWLGAFKDAYRIVKGEEPPILSSEVGSNANESAGFQVLDTPLVGA